ncbi:MAG TPA: prepilin-type N-terminal cleavage/methylation domain-containing protein [Kiritimatiellia bacterium]|nr:prepilin-type N-terminal cleavage/methylation domain-containing protein [Kiritimatiellia bacterium]HMP34749.1 prepilin-type N-terminal cleavage/methylation domain-containing protein [Kiritimatiellia bacterium]
MTAPRSIAPPGPAARHGFSLLEILVAVVLLATAFTIIWSTFSATIDGWRRSREFVDRISHGDFVVDQLVSSMRSAAFFKNRPDKFGFWLDTKGGGDAPRDVISWVTSGSAFMKPEDPLGKGLHRIMVSVEETPDGDPALAIRAFQHLKDEIDKNDVDPWFVSSRIIGLDCEVYNFEDEDWKQEWEDTNAVPSLVQVTLYMEPVEKYGPVLKMQRIIQIPVAPAVTGAVTATQSPGEGGAMQPGQERRSPGGSQPPAEGGGGQGGGPRIISPGAQPPPGGAG